MAHNVIVLVSDLDNAIRGELNVLESVEEATRLVETLIESGFEQERIRVFLGDEMQMEIRHRPVVSLASDSVGQATKEAAQAKEEEGSPAPKEESSRAATARAASLVLDGVTSEPFTRNGKRFSTMFGPDVLSPV
ncbi:MAG: hypothetical protein ABIP58_01165 [Dehalococcoidia bacterium]